MSGEGETEPHKEKYPEEEEGTEKAATQESANIAETKKSRHRGAASQGSKTHRTVMLRASWGEDPLEITHTKIRLKKWRQKTKQRKI